MINKKIVKNWKKDLKKWLALTMTGAMVIGSTITSLASDSLWIEFNELDNGIISEPFEYHGLKCFNVKPGNNEFKFIREKSAVTDTTNLDYTVNILTFNEVTEEWEWCELGGDMTTGKFEYDRNYKMIMPAFIPDGFIGGTTDFSRGEDMTQFTNDKFKGYYEDRPDHTPDWLIHVYVTDYNSQKWDWYFKPNANTAPSTRWKNDEKGWWVEKSDGTYLTNTWYQSPERGLWYYMGSDGYMLKSSGTPDGYYVNVDGVWVQ